MSALNTITAIEGHEELTNLRRQLPGLHAMTAGREAAQRICGVELHTTSLSPKKMALQNSQHELSIILNIEHDGSIITVDAMIFGTVPNS